VLDYGKASRCPQHNLWLHIRQGICLPYDQSVFSRKSAARNELCYGLTAHHKKSAESGVGMNGCALLLHETCVLPCIYILHYTAGVECVCSSR
jgi:hypothetical protein